MTFYPAQKPFQRPFTFFNLLGFAFIYQVSIWLLTPLLYWAYSESLLITILVISSGVILGVYWLYHVFYQKHGRCFDRKEYHWTLIAVIIIVILTHLLILVLAFIWAYFHLFSCTGSELGGCRAISKFLNMLTVGTLRYQLITALISSVWNAITAFVALLVGLSVVHYEMRIRRH